MSGWSDYGFPDISGIHVQTALEGLVSALDERTYAFAGVKYSFRYPDPIRAGDAVPISDVMQHSGNNLQFLKSSTLILRDGTRFSRSAAASFLGEELISVPTWRRAAGCDWSDPFEAIGHDWMLQRFRMLNLMYRTKHTVMNEVLYGENLHSGHGATIAEAVAKANEYYYETSYYGTGSTSRADIVIEESDNWYSANQHILLPKKLLYPLYIPAVLTLEGTAVAPEGGIFNDFGFGLTEGANALPITLPADVAYNTPIEFDTSAVVSNFRSPIPASAGTTGFYFPSYIFADLRPSLEFYDPIEGE